MTVVWSRREIDHLIALRDYIAEDILAALPVLVGKFSLPRTF